MSFRLGEAGEPGGGDRRREKEQGLSRGCRSGWRVVRERRWRGQAVVPGQALWPRDPWGCWCHQLRSEPGGAGCGDTAALGSLSDIGVYLQASREFRGGAVDRQVFPHSGCGGLGKGWDVTRRGPVEKAGGSRGNRGGSVSGPHCRRSVSSRILQSRRPPASLVAYLWPERGPWSLSEPVSSSVYPDG